ncbi:trypsin-like peptidase domain-containing protein [Leptospira paudalimensis]|uniref:S1C family serine protease n=1 Tax=Leptospira paudalimensis TaxID=2950024 RepID=A0ABT3MC35_9LEPT|nr:trypsin-like peptidase domain-containing protein [Leptospira paudalimensis]MCW7505949.1 S1C family serine protease [Leptospira paudalimensis]
MKYAIKWIINIIFILQSNIILSQNINSNIDESILNQLPEFIFNDVKESIVIVSVKNQEKTNSENVLSRQLGVGFIFNLDGLIIINRYALRKFNSDFEITFADGRKIPGKLVGIDEKNNLAILKVANNVILKPIRFNNDSKLKIGQFLILITHNEKDKSVNALTSISKINISDEIYPQNEYSTRESLLISSRSRIIPDPGLLFNIKGEFVGFSNFYFEDDIYTNKFAMANYVLDLNSLVNAILEKEEGK